MHFHRDEHKADDEPGQHGEHAERDTTDEPNTEFRANDAASTRLGQQQRSHGLVPVLARDDERTEHECEEPGIVEHRKHIGEPLRGAVRDDASGTAVSPPGGERESKAESDIDQHDDAEEHIGRLDRPKLADLGLEQSAGHGPPIEPVEGGRTLDVPFPNSRNPLVGPAACPGCIPSPPVSSKNSASSDSVVEVISCTSTRLSSMIRPTTSGVPPSQTT